jgi:hypothetical protein
MITGKIEVSASFFSQFLFLSKPKDITTHFHHVVQQQQPDYREWPRPHQGHRVLRSPCLFHCHDLRTYGDRSNQDFGERPGKRKR